MYSTPLLEYTPLWLDYSFAQLFNNWDGVLLFKTHSLPQPEFPRFPPMPNSSFPDYYRFPQVNCPFEHTDRFTHVRLFIIWKLWTNWSYTSHELCTIVHVKKLMTHYISPIIFPTPKLRLSRNIDNMKIADLQARNASHCTVSLEICLPRNVVQSK